MRDTRGGSQILKGFLQVYAKQTEWFKLHHNNNDKTDAIDNGNNNNNNNNNNNKTRYSQAHTLDHIRVTDKVKNHL